MRKTWAIPVNQLFSKWWKNWYSRADKKTSTGQVSTEHSDLRIHPIDGDRNYTIPGTARGALTKVTTRYRKEFPKLKLETQGTEGEIEMLRIVYAVMMGRPASRIRAISLGNRQWPRTSVFGRESLIDINPWLKFAFERVAPRKNWDRKENVSNHFRFCRRATSSFTFRTHVKRVRLVYHPSHSESDHGTVRGPLWSRSNWLALIYF